MSIPNRVKRRGARRRSFTIQLIKVMRMVRLSILVDSGLSVGVYLCTVRRFTFRIPDGLWALAVKSRIVDRNRFLTPTNVNPIVPQQVALRSPFALDLKIVGATLLQCCLETGHFLPPPK